MAVLKMDKWNAKKKRPVKSVKLNGKTIRGYDSVDTSRVKVPTKSENKDSLWPDDRRILENGNRYFKDKGQAY